MNSVTVGGAALAPDDHTRPAKCAARSPACSVGRLSVRRACRRQLDAAGRVRRQSFEHVAQVSEGLDRIPTHPASHGSRVKPGFLLTLRSARSRTVHTRLDASTEGLRFKRSSHAPRLDPDGLFVSFLSALRSHYGLAPTCFLRS